MTLETAFNSCPQTLNSAWNNQLQLNFSEAKSNSCSETEDTNIDLENIYRPIQYLGSKYRTIPVILSKIKDLISPGSFILDIFSGSSVVSQAINLSNIKVVANDALKFNSVFSQTLLNVGRGKDDLHTLKTVFNKIHSYRFSSEIESAYKSLIHKERDLLSHRNTEQLIEFYYNLPQVWKEDNVENHCISKLLDTIRFNINKSAFRVLPLIANYYAGTYYGLEQSLELDRVRWAIEELKFDGKVNEWQYSFLLTSLLSTASKVVYTAGKHFAQPIKSQNTLNTPILHKRFYEDRLRNVWHEFLESYQTLERKTSQNFYSTENKSMSNTMEEMLANSSNLPKISLIYADPPYTAQQYSRFYHIPEVIFNYSFPQLQIINEKVTSGLYPDNKFKSRFCSKRNAVDAFDDLFKLSNKLGSSIILSYSSSLSNDTGNSRMINLEQLLDLGNQNLPGCSVEILKFDFQYRQLNNSSNIVNTKDDKEVLIIFKNNSL